MKVEGSLSNDSPVLQGPVLHPAPVNFFSAMTKRKKTGDGESQKPHRHQEALCESWGQPLSYLSPLPVGVVGTVHSHKVL